MFRCVPLVFVACCSHASPLFGEDCELLKHGLTIDSVSGELKFVDGCTSVGCGASEAFAVSCTITAQQGSGLTASSQLAVIAYQGLSYGNAPLIFFEDVSLPSSYVPETVGSVTPNSFKLTCSPSDIADQLTVDATSGQLTHSGNAVAGSVTGVEGVGAVSGAVCHMLEKKSLFILTIQVPIPPPETSYLTEVAFLRFMVKTVRDCCPPFR